ncbi:MAG: hypothetical protein KBA75_06865 [Alphaproteobacteria bacterium]|nr:hypothetical protein [Alphaproteobacteria bacterium]
MTSWQVKPFRDWLKENGISPATGYRLVSAGRLSLTKLNARSYVTAEEASRFIAALKNQPST